MRRREAQFGSAGDHPPVNSDSLIVWKCPECGNSYPMKKWNLFYDVNFPEIAQPFVSTYVGQAQAFKEEYDKTKARVTKGATELP